MNKASVVTDEKTLEGSCRTSWRMVGATAEDSLSLAEKGTET